MTPDSIESRLARTDERVRLLTESVTQLRDVCGHYPELSIKLDDAIDDVLAIRMTVERMERDYREDLRARQEARAKQTSTVIAASATVLAAIIGAVALLWVSGALA